MSKISDTGFTSYCVIFMLKTCIVGFVIFSAIKSGLSLFNSPLQFLILIELLETVNVFENFTCLDTLRVK